MKSAVGLYEALNRLAMQGSRNDARIVREEVERLRAAISAHDAEHAADRASRGTEREAGRREGLVVAAKMARSQADQADDDIEMRARKALLRLAARIDDEVSRDATPSPGEMVRREEGT